MTSHAFGAFLDVESSPGRSDDHAIPITPQKVFERTYHSLPVPQGPDSPDVENLKWGAKLNGPRLEQAPRVPGNLETIRPTTPHDEQDEVNVIQSFSNPPMNRFRMLSVCLMTFGGGLSDSAPGALIPYIEKYYSIGYAVLSLIFVTNAIGFILAAFFIDTLRARLGRARTLIMSQSLITSGYIMVVCTPPFPVVILSFFFLGFGMAVNLAIGNVFVANLHNGTKMLGSMHGCYGIGGTVGPLIATAMVTNGRLLWSRYYILTLSVAVFNLVFAGWSFWHYESESGQPLLAPTERIALRSTDTGNETGRPGKLASMAKAVNSKTVILGAIFIFAYQGAEVSISGWVISFLIATRHGDPSIVGYVTSGFWGGITLGRFLLSHPAHKIGEKTFVYGMVIGAAVFELLVWLVPNVIGDAVAVAIVGLLLGPVYPCATIIFSRAIGRKDQVSSLGVISAFGSSGGAVAPFTTGILAQAAGTFVLHPIAIGLFAVMVACWFGLPNVRKRTD